MLSIQQPTEGPNPKKMFKGRGLDLVKPLAAYGWSIHSSEEGAKLAFLNMKKGVSCVASSESCNEETEQSRIFYFKRYLIYDTFHYPTTEAAIENVPLYIYTSLKARSVGCLLIEDNRYLFFWLRS